MRRAMNIGRAIGGYTLGSLSSLGVDANGEIYLIGIGNGSVFKITRGVSKSAPVAPEPVILERKPLADVAPGRSRRRHPLREPCQMRALGHPFP